MKNRFLKTIAAAAASVLTLSAVTVPSSKIALDVDAALLLNSEFETANDSFTGRGGCQAAWVSDEHYNVNCSLFVSERTEAWQGGVRDVSSVMKAGQTYQISAAVLQKSGAEVEMKMSLQYDDASGKTNYSDVALGNAPDGEWTILSNDAYTVPEGATGLQLYVETTESLTDFYIDSVTVKGKPAKVVEFDANGDTAVNEKDLSDMMAYLSKQSEELEESADVNSDGKVDLQDFFLLKDRIKNPPIPEGPVIDGDWDNYQEEASPQMLQVLKDGVKRVGNTERIREKIAKAQAGEEVTIGYIGGSITEDGAATTHDNCFAKLSYEYFKNTFGKGNNVKYVNAGLAGTSSVVGNMRVDNDIFAKNCDVIFIEFAVNDQGDDRFKKSYESLVNKCLDQPNAPAVICITLCTKDGDGNQAWMAPIAEHYDLAIISGRDAVKNGIKAGTLNWDRDYGSNDTIHPGNGGHKLISDIICYYYRQALKSENTSESYVKPDDVVYGKEYSTAKFYKVDEIPGLDKGSWTENKDWTGNVSLKNSKNGNNPLTFKTTGKGILIMFRSKDDNSSGTIVVNVNGTSKKISAKIPWTWGGRDGDVGYYQPNSGDLDVAISMDNPSQDFEIYGIAIIE